MGRVSSAKTAEPVPAAGAAGQGPRTPHVEARSITKRYGEMLALDNVSLEVWPGEILGLMGHNGAGKSTLIKILTGAEQPTSGQLAVAGTPAQLRSVADARSLGVVAVYQELRIIGTVSIAENLSYPVLPQRFGFIDRRQLKKDALRVLSARGIDIDPMMPASQLSQAERQLVEIAAVLSSGAKVVLLDEPTSSLDIEQIERVFHLMRSATAEGVSFVLVTHKVHEVLDCADRIVVLRDGRAVAGGARSEFDHERLVAELAGSTGDSHQSGCSVVEPAPSAHASEIGGTSPAPETPAQHSSTSATSAPALRVAGLVAGGVRRADLDLHFGEVVGLYGVLGAGRTAFLRALFGVNPMRAGEVLLYGQPYSPKDPADSLEHGLYLLSESRKVDGIIPSLSVRNNQVVAALRSFRRHLGALDRGRVRTETDREAQRLDIRGNPDRPVGSLSGGNQQKVLFSRLHMAGARLLLLDEPTRGVDVGAKRRIYQVIRDEAREGKAVIVSSSEAEEICELCSRCYVVRKGRLGDVLLSGDALTPDALRLVAVRAEEEEEEVALQ
jgi:ABC-type sugar transport system ATPase subunit